MVPRKSKGIESARSCLHEFKVDLPEHLKVTDINLKDANGSDIGRPRSYKKAHIWGAEYNTAALPSEEQLISDLTTLSEAQRIIYNNIGSKVQADQELSETITKEAMSCRNLIFFGPPGTGKSYRAKELVGGSNCIRTLFHPEYTYGDFVGTYRPVVGSNPREKV